MVATIKDIEPYAKEITRKHLSELGYRSFEHPCYSSAIVMVKDGLIKGMTNRDILKDNSRTRNILDENMEGYDFLEFEF